MNLDLNINREVLERRLLFMLDDIFEFYFVYWLKTETPRELMFKPKTEPRRVIKIYPQELDVMHDLGYPPSQRR